MNEIPNDLLIHIGTFLVAKDISFFALSSKYYLKLFFNMTCDVPIKSENLSNEMNDLAIEQEKQEFTPVQVSIWKPLVLMYFPKFYADLNVKNWLHILKRRIRHIVQKSPQMLPLGRTVRFPLTDTPFVELCEFIYKCPMDFSAMPIVDEEKILDPELDQPIESVPPPPPINSFGVPPPPPPLNTNTVYRQVRFCSGCNSKVYQITTAKEMTYRAQQKQCVFFNLNIPKPHPLELLGGPPPPHFFTPPLPPHIPLIPPPPFK
ncbi:predicted protein [Naegleria gruberi]|uniref:Predicted protein n=1 Tax=Naegleria gruberi TaxID=5762 RepID=D2V5Z4_NAEGR|nr:uncharacterized protein NAEGRDRAFT_46941 [Naegleria gruberi]EFC47886.1 predicted protein [Naegleria gruberi]|eukprot:XP_002680630.1 predicted protein [Naegleria gruberi strain NEG-M]